MNGETLPTNLHICKIFCRFWGILESGMKLSFRQDWKKRHGKKSLQ